MELQDWFLIPTTPEQRKVVKLIKRIKQEVRMLLNNQEAYQIYSAVKKTAKIEGVIAEVGTFKGGSAKLICEAKGDKEFYTFDTFEGLPPTKKIDEVFFYEGQMKVSVEPVRDYLSSYTNVHIGVGLFPQDTGHMIKNKTFSFVHLDVDLYESTKNCLEFFYPRLNKGGVIISHDYVTMPGVNEAFNEFFRDKPEIILEPSRSQALVVKL